MTEQVATSKYIYIACQVGEFVVYMKVSLTVKLYY